jgi:hypothetical protein
MGKRPPAALDSGVEAGHRDKGFRPAGLWGVIAEGDVQVEVAFNEAGAKIMSLPLHLHPGRIIQVCADGQDAAVIDSDRHWFRRAGRDDVAQQQVDHAGTPTGTPTLTRYSSMLASSSWMS